MHELLALHGDVAFRAATKRALDAEVFGAEYIAHFLSDSVAPEVSR